MDVALTCHECCIGVILGPVSGSIVASIGICRVIVACVAVGAVVIAICLHKHPPLAKRSHNTLCPPVDF